VSYGDATRRESLIAAGIHRAAALVVTFADTSAALKTLHFANELAPALPAIVRSVDEDDLDRLRAGGADEVVPETIEGSLMLASGGRIDVGRGGLVIAPGGAAAAEVRQRLIAGRGQGDWAASTTGIASTAAGPGSGRAVGMITQDDGSIVVSYAAPGDLNLDGMVDIIDLADMLGSGLFDTGLAADWRDGDANYDGVVDMLDISESFATGLFNRGPYLR
jgi:hypothetical protein